MWRCPEAFMVFHCYSFSMVVGFIYLSLVYVGKSYQIILGAGMGDLSCMVPWLVSSTPFLLSFCPFLSPCLPPNPIYPIHQMEVISLGSTFRDTMTAKLSMCDCVILQ